MAHKKKKDNTPTNPVVVDATAKPAANQKVAVKQVYRDPVTRKAFVFFIDANTGTVLSSLEGYQLWEAGKPTTPGTATDPAAPTAPTSGTGTGQPQSNITEDRYLGRGEDRTGRFGSVQSSSFAERNPGWGADDAMNAAPTTSGGSNQTVTSQTYPNNSGQISVTGEGPATQGTYNVNTPSQNVRTSPDVVSGNRQTSGVSQGFSTKETGVSFPSSQPPSTGGATGQIDPASGAKHRDITMAEVHNAFTAIGYTPADATAMTANFAMENGIATRGNTFDLSQKAWGDENSYGLAQWNGTRFEALKEHALSMGKPWSTLEVQVSFVDKEMKSTHRAAYERMVAAQTQAEKVAAVAEDYEITQAVLDSRRTGTPYTQTKEFQTRMAWNDKMVAEGFLDQLNTAMASNPAQAPSPTGFGMVPPEMDTRMPGSGAIPVQSESLAKQQVMSGINYDDTNRMTSFAPARQDITGLGNAGLTAPNYTTSVDGTSFAESQPSEYMSTGWGVADGVYGGSRAQAPSQQRAPDLNNGRTLSGPVSQQTDMSAIGRNPTDIRGYVAEQNAAKQTAAGFAEQPTSSRTLSGPVSTQGSAVSSGREVYNDPNDPRMGKTYTGPDAFQKAMAESPRGPNAVNEAIQFNANEDNTEVTVGPNMGAGKGFSSVVRGASNLFDTVFMNPTNPGLSSALAFAASPTASLVGAGINKNALQDDPINNSVPEAKEWGLREALDGTIQREISQFAPDLVTREGRLADQPFYSKEIQDALTANPNDPDVPQAYRDQYSRMIADNTSSAIPDLESARAQGHASFAPRDPLTPAEVVAEYSEKDDYGMGYDIPSKYTTGPNKAAKANDALAQSWAVNPALPSGLEAANRWEAAQAENFKEDFNEQQRSPTSNPYRDPFTDNTGLGMGVMTPGAPSGPRGNSFYDTPAGNMPAGARMETMDDAARGNTRAGGFVNRGSAFNPDFYSQTVKDTVKGPSSFYDTPASGMPAAEKSTAQMMADIARGFAEGIMGGVSRTADMMGGFGLGGRQGSSVGDGLRGGFDNRGGGFDPDRFSSGGSRFGDGNMPGEGGGRFGGSGLGDSGGGRSSGGNYSGRGGQDSPGEGLGRGTAGSGLGRGDSGGGGYSGGYSGRGGNDSPSEGRSSGPGGGANTGGGFNSGGSGYTGGGPTGGSSSGSSSGGKAEGPSGGGYGGWGGPR